MTTPMLSKCGQFMLVTASIEAETITWVRVGSPANLTRTLMDQSDDAIAACQQEISDNRSNQTGIVIPLSLNDGGILDEWTGNLPFNPRHCDDDRTVDQIFKDNGFDPVAYQAAQQAKLDAFKARTISPAEAALKIKRATTTIEERVGITVEHYMMGRLEEAKAILYMHGPNFAALFLLEHSRKSKENALADGYKEERANAIARDELQTVTTWLSKQ
mgnify:CR=1 FL=1